MNPFKKKTPKHVSEPEPQPDIDVIGFEHDDPAMYGSGRRDVAFGISSADRIHSAIFGMVGSGKSSIIKLLAVQNIQRRQGFMVLDPHGELARDVMSMIPDDMQDNVIYVNPASMYRYGRTIRINPLEVQREEERYVVVMTFVSSLYNLYKDSWGPRLETVLRNAANALVETKYNTLGNLSRIITDKKSREVIMAAVSSPSVRRFWDIFEKQYSKEAGSSAYNKIDKILATPAVAAMLDSAQSSVRIDDIMRHKRMLIVDLSSGASDDIVEFLGSILLQMLYTEAKKRLDMGGGEQARRNPFYVYVDEAHMFSNDTMSEMLRALRKFGVKVTIATQTCNAYSKAFADQITGVCQTIICGRCDQNTARLVSHAMMMPAERIMTLQNHVFAFSSTEGGIPVSGVAKSRPVPHPGQKTVPWSAVAAKSLARWGEEVSASRYVPQTILRDIPVSPLECVILYMLYCRRGGLTRSEIASGARSVFGDIPPRDIAGALVDRLEKEMMFVKRCGRNNTQHVLDHRAYSEYFTEAAAGRRAGGDLHLDTIFAAAEYSRMRGRYCRPDLGESGHSLPDLLIVEPEHAGDRPSPSRWNHETAVALEVEVDPTKHLDQVYINWKKNDAMNLGVWFVAFSQKHRTRIVQTLTSGGVLDSQYRIDVAAENVALAPPFLHDAPILPYAEAAPCHENMSQDGLARWMK